MPEQRMGLKEAGRLLGLSANGVRARAAQGKLRYEKDNGGKWWVFLDPEQVANDHSTTSKLEPPVSSNEGSNLTSKAVDFEPERAALKAHIETLTASLGAAHAEIAALRPKAEAAAVLDAKLAAVQSAFDLSAAEVNRLRDMLAKGDDERRQLLQQLLDRLPAKAENPAAEQPKGFFGWFRRGKA